MFEPVTAFIPELEKGDFGGRTGNGTPEDPLKVGHIEYSEPVKGLISALYEF